MKASTARHRTAAKKARAASPASARRDSAEAAVAKTLTPGLGWPLFLLVCRRHARDEIVPAHVLRTPRRARAHWEGSN
jgi:hypothetical protein